MQVDFHQMNVYGQFSCLCHDLLANKLGRFISRVPVGVVKLHYPRDFLKVLADHALHVSLICRDMTRKPQLHVPD